MNEKDVSVIFNNHYNWISSVNRLKFDLLYNKTLVFVYHWVHHLKVTELMRNTTWTLQYQDILTQYCLRFSNRVRFEREIINQIQWRNQTIDNRCAIYSICNRCTNDIVLCSIIKARLKKNADTSIREYCYAFHIRKTINIFFYQGIPFIYFLQFDQNTKERTNTTRIFYHRIF